MITLETFKPIYSDKRKLFGVFFVILLLVYFGYKKVTATTAQTRYVISQASKQTIINTVSGTGQVTSSNQLDVKPKVSGDIIKTNFTVGSEVKAGDTIAQINSRDAQKNLRDALLSLQSAELSYKKLTAPADELSTTQLQNSLDQATENKKQATDNLAKSYEDGFNSVSNAFLDLSEIMTGLNDILYTGSTQLGGTNQNNVNYYASAIVNSDSRARIYETDTNSSYTLAKQSYDTNLDAYKKSSRFDSTDSIEKLITDTYITTRQISDTLKAANTLIQLYKDTLIKLNIKPASIADTHLNNLSQYISKANSNLTDLLSITNTIKNNIQSITNADRTISEKTLTLENLKNGPTELEKQSELLSLKQRQNAYYDAQEKFSDYFIKSPFDGTIAQFNTKVGDTVSSATTIATILAKTQVAEISLNEVDVAKIKTGNKASMTFDAIDDLTITGKVAQIDQIGTVSQGVVNYTVKIIFDTNDDRIKSGMSVNVSIITDIKPDVLAVPASAVKTSGSRNYIETLENSDIENDPTQISVTTKNNPKQVFVETGVSDDSYTEILSGISEGQNIVTQTINPSAVKPTTGTSATNLLRLGGSSATLRTAAPVQIGR